MNEFKEKWINDIRNRMENHSEPLPADLWERIDAEISTPKTIPLWRKWYSVAAAAAAILVVSSISFSLLNNYVDEESAKMANEILPVVNDDIVLPVSENPVVAKVESSVIESTKKVYPEAGPRTGLLKEVDEIPVSESVDVIHLEERSEPEEVVEKEDVVQEKNETSDTDDVSKKRIDMMKADREVQKRNASYLAMADTDKKRTKRNGLQLGLATGNTPYSSSNSFGGMSRLSAPRSVMQMNDAMISESSDGVVSYSQVLFNNRDRQTYTDVKHHMPVTVGANVKWNINKNWGIETGLNYTYLYSELQSGANSYVEDKQKLHYVGVPLKVHRSIWGNNIVSFYASAGGMVEKCVSGSIETVLVDNNRGKSSEAESVSDKPWQLSVNASLGAQVNFLKFMSLYVEPGMAYYFDDGSELLTIRKDKPFNFNLQFGLRFNIGK